MANTTNLDLVKPAGTDKALVSVINANSDKIDAFAGSTNQALSTKGEEYTYIASTTNRNDELHTMCATLISKVTANHGFNVGFVFDGNAYYGFVWKANARVMFGTLYRGNSNEGFYFRNSTEDATASSTDFNNAQKSDIQTVEYTIPNNTNNNDFNLPTGMNTAVLIGARCYTQYSTWVDASYSGGSYFGDVGFTIGNGKFRYSAKTAGASTKVLFVFLKLS